jgi:GT2 family glycosyltransferase
VNAATCNFSVIICSYTEDRWEMLVRAVTSVCDQTLPADQIVVVVDHCPSLLARARRDLGGRVSRRGGRLAIIPNREQPGLSGARNTGIAIARGSVVGFLDDDAVAAPDWIERLVQGYRDPYVVGVGGQVVPAWEVTRPQWFPPEFDWVVGCSYRGMPQSVHAVRNFIGANMSFRRSVLVDAGGFRPELGRIGSQPLGCEETELCIRAAERAKGSVLLYQPDARVVHTVSGQRATWSYFRARCFAEGLSKATVSRLVDGQGTLGTERSYLLTTIPRGVVTSFAQGLRGQPRKAASGAVMLAGVATTTAGYIVGRCRDVAAPIRVALADRDRTRVSSPVTLAPYAALPLALLIWQFSLRHVALQDMTDVGLVSVLPVLFWLALAVLTLGFCFSVVQPRLGRHGPFDRLNGPLLFGYLLALIAIIHGTPVILYGTLRYSWAWKHVGIVDYISRHGSVHTNTRDPLSIYQAWPGFFALNALLSQASGFASSLSYASWAPPFFNLIVLGPLAMIVRRFTTDDRLIWTTLWVFLLTNWVGQDYFSPQAYNLFLYLSVLAICLRRLQPNSRTSPHQRAASTVLLVTLFAVIATSHQLTPFMLISALAALVVFRRCTDRVLPLVMLAFTIGWILVAARPFFADNLHSILAAIGRPDSNASQNFVSLAKVSAGQASVASVDRLLSVLVWGIASLGVWRLRRDLRRHVPLLLLAISPLPMILINDYGGEMVFRIYLFSLPFVAIFAAHAIFPTVRAGRSRIAPLVAAAVSVVVLAGFLVSYYGKEQTNYFTPAEVAASRWLYSHAPPGSLIIGATSNLPWAFTHYEAYYYEWFALDDVGTRRAVLRDPVDQLGSIMVPGKHRAAYLILTRSQAADVNNTGLLPLGSLTRIEHALIGSGRFDVAYKADDSVVLTLRSPRPE